MIRSAAGHGLLVFLALATAGSCQSAVAADVLSSSDIVNALTDNTRGIGVAEAASGPLPSVNLDISFEVNSDRLHPGASTQLDALAEALASQGLASLKVQIIGHTDSSGSATYNLRLSQQRAEAVRRYLTETRSVDPERLQPLGRGETEPIPGLAPADPKNRRVEIVVAKDK